MTVSEACLKLIDRHNLPWDGQTHPMLAVLAEKAEDLLRESKVVPQAVTEIANGEVDLSPVEENLNQGWEDASFLLKLPFEEARETLAGAIARLSPGAMGWG